MLKKILAAVTRLKSDEAGATMVEYGLMLALIAVICLTAVSAVGTGANSMFNSIAASL